MKERFEFKHIEIALSEIAGCPNFTDMERNWADELWTTLMNSDEPTGADYRKRIEAVNSYLNCGVVYEAKTVMSILHGE